ncbi:hypothetical protein Q4463_09725 [Bacteroides caccae]|uniref:Uncharacterized protein n=1 Tax=Bacteroides caccae TaxID=47678 RepID=A0AAW7WMM2_9BACE|nr:MULTISPECIES: hypothetical protein [Bacteroides]KAB4219400.1 hypothetical protein GAP45_13095 [Bacteroides uniformis]MDO6328015.1 hypothetical protein [Bacteroides caccae]MDO6340409.1 hypothetical protein [Bacteroides caccae]MDO6357427.1 hypothetical protein [Bacteroides caccae]
MDEGRSFNVTGRHTRTIQYSPVYQPVNPIPFWFLPVNIGKVKSCVTSQTSVTKTKHIGKVRGIDLSIPRA